MYAQNKLLIILEENGKEVEKKEYMQYLIC